jgi:hypothetical protein
MSIARTVMGKPFSYSGSLTRGLTVEFDKTDLKISPEIIQIIRDEISTRSPVKMGANRRPLVPDSIGETLYEQHRVSPQVMSYVLPLLVAEGFCTVTDGKPFVIHRVR